MQIVSTFRGFVLGIGVSLAAAAVVITAPAQAEMLGWAADLHETGLGVSHSHYQVHSGYLVGESDMAGFSQQEQQFLATLVRHHRRAIPDKYASGLPARMHEPLRRLLFCLRFAAILCRTRDDSALPRFGVERDGHRIIVSFEPEWAMAHPLTLADLEQERVQLRVPGLYLDVSLGLPGGDAA